MGSRTPRDHRHRATSRIGSKVLLNRRNKDTSRHYPRPNHYFRPKTLLYRHTTQGNGNRTNHTLTISQKTSVSQNVYFPGRLRRDRNGVLPTSNFHHKTSIGTIKRCRVGGRTRHRTQRRRRTRLIVTNNIRPPRRNHSHHRRRRPTTMQRGRPLIRESRIVRQKISSMFKIDSNRVRPRRPSRMSRPMDLVPRIKLRPRTRDLYIRVLFSCGVAHHVTVVLARGRHLHGCCL